MPPVMAQVIPPIMPAAAPVADYNTLMALAGTKMTEGKLTHPGLGTILVEHGIANFQELIPRPDLIAAIYNRIAAL
jgi:hypothetical protein